MIPSSSTTELFKNSTIPINEFPQNIDFINKQPLEEESQKIAQVAADRMLCDESLSSITKFPNELLTLISEFSGNLDFLPAVSEKLYQNRKTMFKAFEISKLAADLASKIAKASLLADEEEANKIADLQAKSVALKDLVAKYTNLITSNRLFRDVYANCNEVSQVCLKICEIAKAIPEEHLHLQVQAVRISLELAWHVRC